MIPQLQNKHDEIENINLQDRAGLRISNQSKNCQPTILKIPYFYRNLVYRNLVYHTYTTRNLLEVTPSKSPFRYVSCVACDMCLKTKGEELITYKYVREQNKLPTTEQNYHPLCMYIHTYKRTYIDKLVTILLLKDVIVSDISLPFQFL